MTTGQAGGAWAGGWDEPGVLSLVLIQAGTPGSGLFVYSGPPAGGNLVYSVTASTGTDPFGNNYLAGETSYNNAASPSPLAYNLNLGSVTWYTYTGNPGAVFTTATQINLAKAGSIFGISTGGYLNLISKTTDSGAALIIPDDLGILSYGTSNTAATADNNTYRVGAATFSASNVNITSTTPVNVVGAPMAPGEGYHVTGFAIYHGNQAAGVPSFSWSAGSSGLVLGGQQNGYETFILSGGGTHINNGALGAANGPTLLNGGVQIYVFDVYVSVTTGGTLFITAAEGNAGDTWEIDEIYMTIHPF